MKLEALNTMTKIKLLAVPSNVNLLKLKIKFVKTECDHIAQSSLNKKSLSSCLFIKKMFTKEEIFYQRDYISISMLLNYNSYFKKIISNLVL